MSINQKGQNVKSNQKFSVAGWNNYDLVKGEDISSMIKQIEGKILTIVDASISDKEQREAIKSLVRNDIWREYQRLSFMSATKDNIDIIEKCCNEKAGNLSTKIS